MTKKNEYQGISKETIMISDAVDLAVHDGSSRLYAITHKGRTHTLRQVNTETHAPLLSLNLGRASRAMAISDDGRRAYVALKGTGAANSELLVVDTSSMLAVQTDPLKIPKSGNSEIQLIPTPSGQLLSFTEKGSKLGIWSRKLDTKGTVPTPKEVNLLDSVNRVVIGSDSRSLYAVGDDSNKIYTLDIENGDEATAITVLPEEARPDQLTLLRSTGPDVLAVSDSAHKKLYLVSLLTTPILVGEVVLPKKPDKLLEVPGANWIYVLTHGDEGATTVTPVSAARLQTSEKNIIERPFTLPEKTKAVALGDRGRIIYAAYTKGMWEQPQK